MNEHGLKYKLVIIVAVLLFVGMLLQSVVVLSLALQRALQVNSVNTIKELKLAAINRQNELHDALISGEITTILTNEISNLHCSIIVDKLHFISEGNCIFGENLKKLSKLAFQERIIQVEQQGNVWDLPFTESNALLISLPVLNSSAEVVATIGIERSLTPVYRTFVVNSKIALFYLVVNVIVLSTIGFFRFATLIFRPMENIVELANSYRSENDEAFIPSRNLGVFRTLSSSLNSMLNKIKSDNKKLRSSVIQLEKLNKELTENQNIILRAEKLASIGRLSSGLAHEIGNPLAIIQGYIDLLNRTDLEVDERNQYSYKANEELERLKKLIRQMLDFSKPRTLAVEAIDIHTLIEEVVDFAKFEKKFVDCSIEKTFKAEHYRIITDPDGLRQVLLNCLFNALDAMADMEEHSKTIYIKTNDISDFHNEPMVDIIIADNGSGVSEENLPKLFDPFFTTKEVGKGTGLGLFVSYTIIDSLGGNIEIQNRVGGGTEVIISLPVCQTDRGSKLHEVGGVFRTNGR